MSDADDVLAALERLASGCYICKGPLGKDYTPIRVGVEEQALACHKCLTDGQLVVCDVCESWIHDEVQPWYDASWGYGDAVECRWCYEGLTKDTKEQ